MKFLRIACVDNVNLTSEIYRQFELISDAPFIACDNDPCNAEDVCTRL